LKEIEKKHRAKVVAFIGDSITEEGIDADQFSRETGKIAANLALPGASPLDVSYFLRAIDTGKNRFDNIFITVIPHSVRGQAHDDGIQTLLPVASIPLMLDYLSTRKNGWRYREDYYAAFDRIFGFRRDLRELLLGPRRWTTLRSARSKQLEKIRKYSGQPFDVCEVKIHPVNRRVLSWGEIQDEEVRRLTRHNINRIARLNRKPEASGINLPLKNIAQAYRDSGTGIIILSVPFGPGHHVDTESPSVRRYLTELKTLENEFGIEHWTAFDEIFFHDCSNFFDYRHLNHKGRRIFSAWISQKWGRK
jgi:hypothetical protein